MGHLLFFYAPISARKESIMTNITSINNNIDISASYFWLAEKEKFGADRCVNITFKGYGKYPAMKALAPNESIIKEYKEGGQDWERYTQRYQSEVLARLDVHEVARQLAGKIILSSEGPKTPHCHRKLVVQWLQAAGYKCREYGSLSPEEKQSFWVQKDCEEQETPQTEEEPVKAPTSTATPNPEVDSIVALIKAKMLSNKKRYGNAVAFQSVATTALKKAVLNQMIKTSRVPVTILVDDGERKKALTTCAERTKLFEVVTPHFYYNNKGEKCYHPEDRPKPGSLVIVETRDKASAKDLRILAPGCWIVRVVSATPK